MKRFVISSAKLPGDIVLEYNIDGNLLRAEFPEDMSVDSCMFFFKNMPMHTEILMAMKERFKMNVTEVRDYSFDAFWEAYKYKVGSKDICRSLWEGNTKTCNKRPVGELDREQIMAILPRYVKKLGKSEFRKMPETFLRQRIWVAEYENTIKDVDNNPYLEQKAREIAAKMKVV